MGKGGGRREKGYSRIREEIAILYPPADREKAFHRLQKEKRSALIRIGLTGILFLLVICLYYSYETILEEDGSIKKSAYGEGEKHSELTAVIQHGEEITEERIAIDIPEKQYTKQEIEELFNNMLPELEQVVLAENESMQVIHSDLNFVKKLSNYPFQMSWETDNYQVVDATGAVNNGAITEGGSLVQIKAEITYEEFKKDYSFYVRVIPSPDTAAKTQSERLQEAVEEAKENTKYDDYFVLPKFVGTDQIVWKEEKTKEGFLFVIPVIAACVGVFLAKDQEVHKKVEKRNKELQKDYSEIVSKLALLIGAGMTLRGAFGKIAADYKKKRKAGAYRYAYEEILYTCNEINAGVSEVQAYVNWGQRCHMKMYLKLSMLLVQNLKKGSAGLIRSLREETELAFAEKKAGVKRAGEEAGTKLLLPMGLMLLIVIILIIVPAFCSFG